MRKVFIESCEIQKSDEFVRAFFYYIGDNMELINLAGLLYEKRKIYCTPHLFKVIDEKKFLLFTIKYNLKYKVLKDNRVKYYRREF